MTCSSTTIILKLSKMPNEKPDNSKTFNLPSNRFLWECLGEYDALVEYQEVANRLMLQDYKSSNKPFDAYLKEASAATGIKLNDVTLENYKEKIIQGYLIYPNAIFDEFLTLFIVDVCDLIDTAFAESKIDGCRFDRVMDALDKKKITPAILKVQIDLYNYYRLLRNGVAHGSDSEYEKAYKKIDKAAIKSFYPSLSEPQPKDSLGFDDFILCTANIKNIADAMTKSIFTKVDWVARCKANKDKWFPRRKRFMNTESKRRLYNYINNTLVTLYGVKLTNYDLDVIIGSRE